MFPSPKIPELFQTPEFETALTEFKNDVIEHIAKHDTDLANDVTESLNKESTLSSKIVEACTYILLNKIRQDNDKVLNNFAPFARNENLDLVVSNLGLERQLIKKGDPDAIPPIPDEMESDEHLLLRYYLVPFSLKPGSAKGYEYACLTLDEKPTIQVDATTENQVIVTYQFNESSEATKVLDAHAEWTNDGEVTVNVLGRDSVADASLINKVSTYINRRDIKEATDTVIVNAATHEDYTIHVQVPTPTYSTPEFIKQQIEIALDEFATNNRKLNNTVRPEHIGGVLHELQQIGYNVVSPTSAVATGYDKAPNCINITVEFI